MIENFGLHLLQLVENFSDPEIDLLSKIFFEIYHPHFDILGLFLDLFDLAFNPIDVIFVDGGKAIPLQTADVISVEGFRPSLH